MNAMKERVPAALIVSDYVHAKTMMAVGFNAPDTMWSDRPIMARYEKERVKSSKRSSE